MTWIRTEKGRLIRARSVDSFEFPVRRNCFGSGRAAESFISCNRGELAGFHPWEILEPVFAELTDALLAGEDGSIFDVSEALKRAQSYKGQQ